LQKGTRTCELTIRHRSPCPFRCTRHSARCFAFFSMRATPRRQVFMPLVSARTTRSQVLTTPALRLFRPVLPHPCPFQNYLRIVEVAPRSSHRPIFRIPGLNPQLALISFLTFVYTLVHLLLGRNARPVARHKLRSNYNYQQRPFS
jgi:hypothetical protein